VVVLIQAQQNNQMVVPQRKTAVQLLVWQELDLLL
jgi:hypothetical protein